MCVVSMIFDHYHDKWSQRPPAQPYPWPFPYSVPDSMKPLPLQPAITPEEIEEFRKLLARAREYDKRNNEPDCELEEKRKKVKELAEALGVKINFL